MKLRPQSTEKQQETSADIMTQMQSLMDEQTIVIGQKSAVIAEQKKRIERLESYLRLANQKRFGASSEQTSPDQGELFNEVEDCAEPEQDELPLATPTTPKAKTGRKPFNDKLPRHQVFAYLSETEKAGAIDTFFVKVREELDIIPAQVRVLEYLQEKATFKTPEGGRTLKVAEVIKHPVPKAMGSVNLMTYIIISKYADGLPLYRLENIIKSRYGGDITRATMANWVIALAKQAQPLIHLLRDHQHSGQVISMDETTLQVLKEQDRVATSKKYRWVSLGGQPGQQSVLFEYDPSRSAEVPLRLLDGFTNGYLQTDGYVSYNEVCRQNKLTHLGCWDHGRRKFKEAAADKPKKSKGKLSKADMALSYINKLYKIEREIESFEPAQKREVRQQKAVPILNDLKTWLKNNMPKVPKDSLTWKAMTYLSNQWEKLTVYVTNGQLRLSNILAENAIRPFVIGRKAWLFCDTPRGAHASSVHYSLIETAKLHGLEPYGYLNAIFKALPYADTVEKFEALLPWNYKKQLQAA
jgi:transposase